MSTTTQTTTRTRGGDSRLNRAKLYRFGAIIAGAVVLLAGASLFATKGQSDSLAKRNAIALTRDDVLGADMLHDEIRATVYANALPNQLGKETVARIRLELDESVVGFTDLINAAIAIDADPEITKQLQAIVEEVQVYGSDSANLADSWSDFKDASPDTRATAKQTFVTWDATFEKLKSQMEGVEEAIDVTSKQIVEDADSSGRTANIVVLLAALAALGVFAFVWRKVLRSVDESNAMQDEMARISAMVENSPTNMMFCNKELVVQYANPAMLSTLRSLESHLSVAADAAVGSSIDLLHPDGALRAAVHNPAGLPYHGQAQIGPDTVEVSISAINDSHGNYIGAMSSWTVITERVRMAAEAEAGHERERAAAAELQSKVDSIKGTLAAAAAGDLTAVVTVTGDDAVGQMGVALTKLLADLRESVTSIAVNSEALAGAADELQVVSSQMGANSAETSNQVNLVSSASNEVSRNVETVTSGAEQMSASIKEIARNAAEAAKVASQAVEAAKVTNETVTKLGDSSAEIGLIVKVITGIAQQTNLLALNATIEAARAGEAGKGFAVVANEVKELAKETAKATEDISAKIEAIQADTQSSVQSISGILDIINQIAEFQDTIASAVEEQAATTSEIARSVNDASRGTTEITANMQNVSQTADSTASGAANSQRAATELSRMAGDLQSLVGRFTY